MICGTCAHEQPFRCACFSCRLFPPPPCLLTQCPPTTCSTKPCANCGFTLAGTKRSTHWEGGTGCRDAAAMSRLDRKKFSGSAAKTRSKKADRVGPKSKREHE